ncbi:hypothetical protein DC498_12620 [Terrimonas sp.]|nr:hypothetical protein DC498_12620 [Terrimonas sp.]
MQITVDAAFFILRLQHCLLRHSVFLTVNELCTIYFLPDIAYNYLYRNKNKRSKFFMDKFNSL